MAAYLDITRQRVHQLDNKLQPTRCACGYRRYDQATVVAYAKKREGDRVALSLARSARMRAPRKVEIEGLGDIAGEPPARIVGVDHAPR